MKNCRYGLSGVRSSGLTPVAGLVTELNAGGGIGMNVGGSARCSVGGSMVVPVDDIPRVDLQSTSVLAITEGRKYPQVAKSS